MESNGKHVTLDGDARRLRDRPDLLGRAGHQRPALVLSADPSGHAADPLRLHRLRPDAQSAGPPSRHADGQRLRPGRGAGLRQDAPSRSRPRARRTGWCRTASSKATGPSNTILLDRLTPGSAGQAGRALRAQRLHAGRDLGDRLVRPVGRRAGQGAGPAHHSANWRARPSRSSTHDSSTNTSDPALPQAQRRSVTARRRRDGRITTLRKRIDTCNWE